MLVTLLGMVMEVKAGAAIERRASNACHAVGDGDGGEAGAAIERTTTNACHAVGDGDGGKAGTAIERIITNACHAVGDGHLSHAFMSRSDGRA